MAAKGPLGILIAGVSAGTTPALAGYRLESHVCRLLAGQLEHAVLGEPAQVARNRLLQIASGHAAKVRQVRIEEDLMPPRESNPLDHALQWNDVRLGSPAHRLSRLSSPLSFQPGISSSRFDFQALARGRFSLAVVKAEKLQVKRSDEAGVGKGYHW